jgi:hypothetical protein
MLFNVMSDHESDVGSRKKKFARGDYDWHGLYMQADMITQWVIMQFVSWGWRIYFLTNLSQEKLHTTIR